MIINDGFSIFMLNFKKKKSSTSFVLGFTIGVLLGLRNPLSVEFPFLDRQNKFKESDIVN